MSSTVSRFSRCLGKWEQEGETRTRLHPLCFHNTHTQLCLTALLTELFLDERCSIFYVLCLCRSN